MPGIRIEWAPVKILAVTGTGHVRTIIVDGEAGQRFGYILRPTVWLLSSKAGVG
jgi:hypothetical protein